MKKESLNRIHLDNPDNLTQEDVKDFSIRYAARAIMITPENKVVLIFADHKIHTVIGGGVEKGESFVEALHRECKEETGYNIEIIEPLGYIEFWRKDKKRISIGHGFLVKTIGVQDKLSITNEEIEEGHEVREYEYDKAIRIVTSELEKYNEVSSSRTLMFLKEAQKHL